MELFRFVLARPANAVKDTIHVGAEFRLIDRGFQGIKRDFGGPKYESLDNGQVFDNLQYGQEMTNFDSVLHDKQSLTKAQIEHAAFEAFPKIKLDVVVGNKSWSSDEKLLDAALIRIHVQGQDFDDVGPKLVRFRQLYELLRDYTSDEGTSPSKFRLKPLVFNGPKVSPPQPGTETLEDDENAADSSDTTKDDINTLSQSLRMLNSRDIGANLHIGLNTTVPEMAAGWRNLLHPDIKDKLINLIPMAGQDHVSYPDLYNTILSRLRVERKALEATSTPAQFKPGFVQIGSNAIQVPIPWPGSSSGQDTSIDPAIGDFLGDESVQTGDFSLVRPSGYGQLIVVRSHLLKYEGGEIGNIQTVLKSEHMIRETKRLERTEQTTVESETQENEQERDNQTTERFSLNREVDNTLKDDSSTKMGLSVSAKYGPFVEAKADYSHAEANSSQNSTKLATTYSKDVVSRAASKVIQKTFKSTTVTEITQFQENFRHEFDNRGAQSTNISGLYQWVNKVTQSQMFDYGERLLFDLIVPEPAQFLMELANNPSSSTVTEPIPLTESPQDIDETNYATIGARYLTSGLKPPPSFMTSLSQGMTVEAKDSTTRDVSAVMDIKIPVGYQAYMVTFGYTAGGTADTGGNQTFPVLTVTAGVLQSSTSPTQAVFSSPYVEGDLSIGASIANGVSFSVVARVSCFRKPEAYIQWQIDTYNSIVTAYTVVKSNYDRISAQTAINSMSVVTGENPAENENLIRNELKKACISMMAWQTFQNFNGINYNNSKKYPQIDIIQSLKQGQYITFFEQAFEWEELQYVFYPYYWSRQSTWQARNNFNGSPGDPNFTSFVKSGAARVSFGARKGFEKDVLYFLQTGQKWKGGPISTLHNDDYLPIADEIASSQQRLGKEKPIGDPWSVSVPTELVRLRSNDKLPIFQSSTDTKGVVTWSESTETADQ